MDPLGFRGHLVGEELGDDAGGCFENIFVDVPMRAEYMCENPHVATGITRSANPYDYAEGKLVCGRANAECRVYANQAPCQRSYWTGPRGEYPPLSCRLDAYWAPASNAWAECFNDP